MLVLLWLVGVLCLVTSVLHIATSGAVIIRAVRDRRPLAPLGETPPVSILRPVYGIENHIEETLRSSFHLTYPDYELIFCAASNGDPIVPVVRRLMAEYPDVPSRLLIGDDRISINPKLNNLVKGWAAARHEFIAMTDSNVLMPPDYLERLLSRWTDKVGMVCSPAYGTAPDGFAAELECAFLNTYEARWQVASDFAGMGFAQGKTMLWRRDVLDSAGGMIALASEPAEDAASTKVVRQAGLQVRLSNLPFAQPLGTRTFAEVWLRQLRWARLRRVTFWLFFTSELFSSGFLPILSAAILVAGLGLSPLWFLAFIAVWYGLEALIAWVARWPLHARDPLFWIVRDILLPGLWVSAWMGTKFNWRGNEMDVAGSSAAARTRPLARLKPLFERLRDSTK